MSDAAQIIQDLYASEINARIEWFYDGGFSVSIGDMLSGWKATDNLRFTGGFGLFAGGSPDVLTGIAFYNTGYATSQVTIQRNADGTFTETGGTPGFTFSITSGSLPAGLTLNTSTGVISGTPAGRGSYTFTARLDNSYTGSRYSIFFSDPYEFTGTYKQLPGYDLVNIRTGIAFDAKWSAALFVNNRLAAVTVFPVPTFWLLK